MEIGHAVMQVVVARIIAPAGTLHLIASKATNEVVPVFVVPCSAAFGGEVELIPPFESRARDGCQRNACWTTVSEASHWSARPKYDAAKQNVIRLAVSRSNVLPAGGFSHDHHCSFWNQTDIY